MKDTRCRANRISLHEFFHVSSGSPCKSHSGPEQFFRERRKMVMQVMAESVMVEEVEEALQVALVMVE